MPFARSVGSRDVVLLILDIPNAIPSPFHIPNTKGSIIPGDGDLQLLPAIPGVPGSQARSCHVGVVGLPELIQIGPV